MNRQISAAEEYIPGDRSSVWPLVLAFALAAFAVLWASYPPLMDYPNHLARIWLLAGGAKQSPVSEMYEINWSQVSTNISVDWIASRLAMVLPFPVVDRILRLMMLLGPPLGAVFLGRAVFGRFAAWHLASLAFVWRTTAIAGFLSYSISLAAALFFAAYLQRRQGKIGPKTLAIHALFSCILLSTHPFGLLFYLALVVGIVIGPDIFTLTRQRIRDLARSTMIFVLIALVPVIVLSLLSSSIPATNRITWVDASLYARPVWMVKMLVSPILSYDLVLDVLFTLPVVVVVFAALATRRIRFHFGLLLVAFLIALFSLAAPHSIGDASWMHRRLPLMAALAGFAAILPQPRTSRWTTIMLIVLAVATLSKVAWIGRLWNERDRDAADMLAVTSIVKPGDAIIVVKQDTSDPSLAPQGRYMVGAPGKDHLAVRSHFPALLVPLRQAFIPTLFAVPGQHPIQVTPARQADAVVSSTIPFPEDLLLGGDAYLERWRCDFQYVLLIGADEPTQAPISVDALRLVAARGFAALYEIEPAGPGESCGPSSRPPSYDDEPR
ncbi:MAG: hypothetical protein R3E09_02305 [Novosphingobium sp.]